MQTTTSVCHKLTPSIQQDTDERADAHNRSKQSCLNQAVWAKWSGPNGLDQVVWDQVVWAKWSGAKWYGPNGLGQMVWVK